ncbi:hypothetical protein SpCBS45565_g02109 [Spizellomyces sp. 'palustris']|nr:hypothetical protein SpCBS45565_g02109 [Spizellomyces sp. 'palustris']
MTAAVSASVPAPAEKTKVDAFEVGWLFVQEYYTFLNRDPQRLHCFYNKKSSFLHGHEGEATAKTCHGQQEIHSRIVELDFQDCKVLVSNVDSQASLNGGIVVQVLGEMSNKGGASHKFAQTFFLAEQPNGYYVLNDIFRFLKEDIDNEYEDAEDPTGGLELQEAYVPEETTQPSYVEPVSAEPEVRPATPRTTVEKARSPSPLKEEVVPVPEVKPAHADESRVTDNVASDAYGLATWEPTPAAEPVAESKAAWGAIPKSKPVAAAQEITENKKASTQSTSAQNANTTATGKQAAPTTPSKPKTWASLAANNAASWGPDVSPAKGHIGAGQNKAPPAPQQRPASPQKPVSKPAEKSPVAEPASEATPASEHKDGGFREVQNRQHKRASQPPQQQQQQHQEDDREKFSIYIRGISEAIDKKSLTETFSKVGTVRNVDLIPSKNIAFVEFTTVEAAQKAIGNSFTVNGQTVTAEERRKPRPYSRNGPPGQYPQRRDYHDGGARGRGDGGFHNRGAQGNRGRGGYGGSQKSVAAGKPMNGKH